MWGMLWGFCIAVLACSGLANWLPKGSYLQHTPQLVMDTHYSVSALRDASVDREDSGVNGRRPLCVTMDIAALTI